MCETKNGTSRTSGRSARRPSTVRSESGSLCSRGGVRELARQQQDVVPVRRQLLARAHRAHRRAPAQPLQVLVIRLLLIVAARPAVEVAGVVVVRQRRHRVRVDLHLALVDAGGVDGHALHRREARDAGVQVEVVAVQRADDVLAADRAVPELPAAVRAAVVEGVRIAAVATAREREIALVHAHRHRLVRRQLLRSHDRHPSAPWRPPDCTRIVAIGGAAEACPASARVVPWPHSPAASPRQLRGDLMAWYDTLDTELGTLFVGRLGGGPAPRQLPHRAARATRRGALPRGRQRRARGVRPGRRAPGHRGARRLVRGPGERSPTCRSRRAARPSSRASGSGCARSRPARRPPTANSRSRSVARARRAPSVVRCAATRSR